MQVCAKTTKRAAENGHAVSSFGAPLTDKQCIGCELYEVIQAFSQEVRLCGGDVVVLPLVEVNFL